RDALGLGRAVAPPAAPARAPLAPAGADPVRRRLRGAGGVPEVGARIGGLRGGAARRAPRLRSGARGLSPGPRADGHPAAGPNGLRADALPAPGHALRDAAGAA